MSKALDTAIANYLAAQALMAEAEVAVAALLPSEEPALTQPKADPAKIYRSKPGKERAKVEAAKVWEDAKAKAGVKRVKDLPAKARAKADADVKAIWAAVPKTRTTKG